VCKILVNEGDLVKAGLPLAQMQNAVLANETKRVIEGSSLV
jgi:multidrug efflux pump subunit AcrA (membrane-fusion protein)